MPPYPYRILETVAGECFQSFASISNPGPSFGVSAGDEDRAKRPKGSPERWRQARGRLRRTVKVYRLEFFPWLVFIDLAGFPFVNCTD